VDPRVSYAAVMVQNTFRASEGDQSLGDLTKCTEKLALSYLKYVYLCDDNKLVFVTYSAEEYKLTIDKTVALKDTTLQCQASGTVARANRVRCLPQGCS
jgi:hypothetical protein